MAGIPDISGANVLVLGLGVSGMAAAVLARLHGAQVTVLDEADSDRLQERARRLTAKDVDVHLECCDAALAPPPALAVISPGIGPATALGRLAANLDCPVISELELGYRFCHCPLLAVTGTNGKTTTVELVTHCLKAAGKRVVAAGNIGLPLCEAVRKSGALDFIVAEVSSFQLERIHAFAPLAAACLNVTSDHLDRYDNAEAYLRTKLEIFRNIQNPARAVLSRTLWDDARVQAHAAFAGGRPTLFAAEAEVDTDYLLDADGNLCRRTEGGFEALLEPADLRLAGRHNMANTLAALAICRAAGVPEEPVIEAMPRFVTSAHRFELLSVSNGVRYINDSKATNPDAMLQALQSCRDDAEYPGEIILIAGGRDKDMDFDSVTPALRRGVREVCLLGETRETLAQLWGDTVPCRTCVSMRAAVNRAVEDARPGDTVLLSPGCASFDMFDCYQDRGKEFVNALKRRLEP